MPVVIEELSTRFDIHDEVKIRKLVREEIHTYMKESRSVAQGGRSTADPANPAAADVPSEERGG